MAHFWGKLRGYRGEATRDGNEASGLVATLASWSGAVVVETYIGENGEDRVKVSLTPSAGEGVEATVYDGPMAPKKEIVPARMVSAWHPGKGDSKPKGERGGSAPVEGAAAS